MNKCVCNYTPSDIQKIINAYKRNVLPNLPQVSNVSIFQTYDGKIFLVIHKGNNCICWYELLKGKWDDGEWGKIEPINPE